MTKKPPAHLSPASKRLYRSVLLSYRLEDWHIRLLVTALDAQDRAEEARQRVQVDGAFVSTRFGELKPHPGLAVARDATASALRAWKALGLDLEGPPPPSSRKEY